MVYYITKDTSGKITNLFRDDYTAIPAGAIPITEAEGEQLRHGFAASTHSGNTVNYIPVVHEVQVPVPQLTPRQVRLVLNTAGLRAAVEAAVAAADQDTRDMWDYSSVFLRNDPVLLTMAASLGITSQQLDQLFTDGAQL